MIDNPILPPGWTMDRVRELEPGAVALDPAEHFVVADQRPSVDEYEELQPETILSFAGLCLCLVREAGGAGYWWMGDLDESDGSIACWSPYSDDLGDAIRAM